MSAHVASQVDQVLANGALNLLKYKDKAKDFLIETASDLESRLKDINKKKPALEMLTMNASKGKEKFFSRNLTSVRLKPGPKLR